MSLGINSLHDTAIKPIGEQKHGVRRFLRKVHLPISLLEIAFESFLEEGYCADKSLVKGELVPICADEEADCLLA